MPEGVLVYNRKKKSVRYVNSVVQDIFNHKNETNKISERNADRLLTQVKLKLKKYGEQED